MTETINVHKEKESAEVTDEMIDEVVEELVGEDALPVVEFLKGKEHISEFIVAEELDQEIHETRKLLYKLLEHNIVEFERKKDKVKGWYICYWDLNKEMVPYLVEKIRKEKLENLRERLENEEKTSFYMCNNACIRMSFEEAMEFDFQCPECGQLMEEKDNSRTIEFLKEKIEKLENSLE